MNPLVEASGLYTPFGASTVDSQEMKCRVRFISDVHLEHYFFKTGDNDFLQDLFKSFIEPDKYSILCLLGDIGNPFQPIYQHFIGWCSCNFSMTLLLTGNHEYYGHSMNETHQQIERLCKFYTNVLFMNNNIFVYHKRVVFIGTTLWSYIPSEHAAEVSCLINDYRFIYDESDESDESDKKGEKKCIDVKKVNEIHKKNVKFLERTINMYKNYKVIVLSHHAPFMKNASAPIYETNHTNYAFSSDQSQFFDDVDVWAYGHTHYNHPSNFVKTSGKTIGISNQAGYPGSICKYHNSTFSMVL